MRIPVTLLVSIGLLAGCADKHVSLTYLPERDLGRVASSRAVTVFPFSDARGSEGDRDPYRVGGVYGGYGNRLSRVLADKPWRRTLCEAIAAALSARGVEATAVPDREWALGTTVATPLVLTGEIRNFSTESRWSTTAHVSGIVRLRDAASGAVLAEKMISERETWGMGAGVMMASGPLEDSINKALAGFVRKVVTDSDIGDRLRTSP
jgi:hypothetical protein